MTPEEADAMQEWKGMPDLDAFAYMREHSDTNDDMREMMHAWFRANGGTNEIPS